MVDIGSDTAGEVTTEHTANVDAIASVDDGAVTSSHEPDETMTSAGITTDSAAPINISTTEQVAMPATDSSCDIAASVHTPASEPSSASASVSCTTDFVSWL